LCKKCRSNETISKSCG